TVRPNPSVPLRAEFVTQVKDTDKSGVNTFNIFFEHANPFELVPPGFDIGELTENSPTKTVEFVIGSATRGVGAEPPYDKLPEPSIKVLMPGGAGEPGPFVSVGKPVPILGEDLDNLAGRVSSGPRNPVRLLSAWKVPVTISPRVGDARIDIGQLDREIWVTFPGVGGDAKFIKIRGNVRGSIWLTDAKEIDLETFAGKDGVTKAFELTVEKAGTEVALVPDQIRPDFLQVVLEKLPDRGGQ